MRLWIKMLAKEKLETIKRNLRYVLDDLEEPSPDEEVLLDDVQVIEACKELLQKSLGE